MRKRRNKLKLFCDTTSNVNTNSECNMFDFNNFMFLRLIFSQKLL